MDKLQTLNNALAMVEEIIVYLKEVECNTDQLNLAYQDLEMQIQYIRSNEEVIDREDMIEYLIDSIYNNYSREQLNVYDDHNLRIIYNTVKNYKPKA
jgi:capsular polysaccharide biosynthesis protein